MFGLLSLARQYHPTARILIGIAVAVGIGLAGAAPAGADPSPFNTLSCRCPDTSPSGSAARADEIARGLHRGLTGLPSQTPR